MALSAAIESRRRFHRARRWIWLTVAVVAALALGFLAYEFRADLSAGFDVLVEETGSIKAAVVCLAVGLLALAWLALWMLLPIVVFFGLKDLRRRAYELDETSRLCARHLARLSDSQPLPASEITHETDRPIAADRARPVLGDSGQRLGP